MSALADNVPHIRAMGEVDLHAIIAIETAIYTPPLDPRQFSGFDSGWL